MCVRSNIYGTACLASACFAAVAAAAARGSKSSSSFDDGAGAAAAAAAALRGVLGVVLDVDSGADGEDDDATFFSSRLVSTGTGPTYIS